MVDPNTTNRNRSRNRRGEERGQSVASIVLDVSEMNNDQIDNVSDVIAEVAGPAHATVHLVCTFSTDEFEKTVSRLKYDADSPPDPDEIAKRSQSVRRAATELRDPVRNYGMPITVHGRVTDDTGEAIVDTATEVNADRVVICGGNRSPTGKAIFGSTAQYALLNSPCPVTFVRGD